MRGSELFFFVGQGNLKKDRRSRGARKHENFLRSSDASARLEWSFFFPHLLIIVLSRAGPIIFED